MEFCINDQSILVKEVNAFKSILRCKHCDYSKEN